MKLNFRKAGQGKPLVILHGLLGMLDNWQTIGKILSSDYEVFLVDARNHGHSPHSDVFSYDSMADDLLEFINLEVMDPSRDAGAGAPGTRGVSVIGHSMGGKTAMKFAQLYPGKVEKLIVVDMAPKQYPVFHDQMLDALLAVDFNILKSRGAVEVFLAEYIPEEHTLKFLLKNLYWAEAGKLAWRFNLSGIIKNIEKVGEATTSGVFNKPALFLRSDVSGYVSEEDTGLIKKLFPGSEIITIPGAGHWIHADQPELLVKAVKDFLRNNSIT